MMHPPSCENRLDYSAASSPPTDVQEARRIVVRNYHVTHPADFET
jgi:hypothetical protein